MARLRSAPPRLGAPPARLRAAPKVAERFYLSREWLALVERRKGDADYAAAQARRKDAGERLILDHIVERKDGGADLDPANTQWLTHSEHQAKTFKVKRERARGWSRRGGGQKSGG